MGGGITSQPVAYANVSLYPLPDTALYTGCVTDTNVFFEFKSTGAQAYLSGTQAYLLKVTYVGYKDFTTELEKSAVFLEIRLEEENRQLENITVTASKPMFRLADNGIQVNVSHSLLNKENTPIDILRKIPGLTLNKGKLEAFGLGEPIIYINEKKVMDFSEVE